MIKLSDIVFDFVAKSGVKHVFMLPGGGCMHLVDSLGRNKKLQFIVNLHEQACAIAAEAYGQYTNNLGVSLVTTGPGGTNALTGVAGAWCESTPCLFISGQVKREDMMGDRGVRQMGPQEIDIVSIVKPIIKYAITVMDPESILYHLGKALYLAQTGRPGPVWIDIPLDVQATMIEEIRLKEFVRPAEAIIYCDTLCAQIDRVFDLLKVSKRPVILVGNGVRLANAKNQFLELIETLNIPVLTTWKMIDFLEDDHRLYIGRPGSSGQRAANFCQQNADLLIVIGARLDLPQLAFNHEWFARDAQKVMVDIDAAEINKMKIPIEVPINVDAKFFIDQMLAKAKIVNLKDYSGWLNKCVEWRKKYPVVLPEYWQLKDKVNLYVLVDVISGLLSEEDVVIPGSSGPASEAFMQSFRVKKGQRVFNTSGLGAMGFGFPASIGACLASGGKRTILINGDGGFQLNIQELETLRRLQLPIKIFILDNNGYASIMTTQRNYFDGRYYGSEPSGGLTLPDIYKIALAYGINARTIVDQSNLRDDVKEFLNLPGPAICNVKISPDQVLSPRVKSSIREDGKMVTLPMEDMWPFLDRNEFLGNMMIKPTESNRNITKQN
jgi:acetolactate synthase-1/2/3 large subunit